MAGSGTPEQPMVAGMYDCYLGGTANSAADRAAVERVAEVCPEAIDAAWANRGFLQRAVKRMAEEWGVRQFLDIGAGLPTQRNTHDVVAESVPDCHVVYVDVDPVVVTRGHELLAGVPGAAVLQGDFSRPDEVLGHPDTKRLIDFTQPVGLLLVAVTQFVPDSDDPWATVARYVDAIPTGSCLALSAPTGDHQAAPITGAVTQIYATTPTPVTARTKGQVERFFTGLDIVPPHQGAAPGVVYVGEWGADDPEAADSDGSRWVYAAVGRKP